MKTALAAFPGNGDLNQINSFKIILKIAKQSCLG